MINIALVGISKDTKDILETLSYSKSIKVAAIFDKDSALLKSFCEEYLLSGYRKYNDLVENENIDYILSSRIRNEA